MECIYKLPRELQLNILEFYYRKKSDDFCEDVKSFIITRNVLIADYQAYFKVYWYDHNEENYLDWLANDITIYMNEYLPTMDGYTSSHTKMWKRLFYFKNKTNDEIYNIRQLAEMEMPVMRDICTRIGIMTPKERRACISEMIQTVNIYE
jgi:hypothetical protein